MFAYASVVFRVLWATIRRRPLITLGVGVNLVLVFLPFYDWNNIAFLIGQVGGLSNTGPSLARTPWPAGFFFLAPFTIAYLTYVATGFQIYWAVAISKVAAFGLTGAGAWVLFRIGARTSPRLGTLLATFVLLNPVLLFINYVWIDWDIYPIFFLFLGYYILRYRPLGTNEHFNRLIGTAALMISVLFYWYALVAIPIMLAYSGTNRERAWLFVYSAVLFGVLMSFDVTFFVSSPWHNFLVLAGGSPTYYPVKFFGFPYYVTLGLPAYLALAGAIVLGLPLVLRRAGISEPAALFVVLLLFIWTSPFQLPDNYSWVFWFTPLLFLAASKETVSWPAVGLSLGVPLAGVVVVSLFFTNGQADGQGVFYLGYDLLHSNYQFFPTPAARGALLVVWNAVTLILVVASLGLVLWTGRHLGPEMLATEPATHAAPPEVTGLSERVPPARTRRFFPWKALAAAGLVVAITASALVFNSGLPNLLNYQGSGPLPTLALDPVFGLGGQNVPRPIPNATYVAQGSKISIFTHAPPLGFIANPAGRSLSANLSFELSGHVPTDTVLVQDATHNLSLVTLWSVDEARAPRLSAQTSLNVSNGTLGYQLMNAGPQVFNLGQASDLIYALNSTALSSGYLFWSYQFTRTGGEPVPVFELTTAAGFATLVSYPDHATVTYGSGSPSAGGSSLSNPFSEISRQWNFEGLHVSGGQLWLDFNGVVETVPAPWGAGSATLRLGMGGAITGAFHASNERVSPIRVGSFGPGPVNYSFLNWTNATGTPHSEYFQTAPLLLQYAVQSGPGGTQVSASGERFAIAGMLSSVFFGKGSPGNYSVVVTIHQLVIHEPSPGYYLVPAFLAVVGLYAFPAWACWRMRAPPSRQRAPTDA